MQTVDPDKFRAAYGLLPTGLGVMLDAIAADAIQWSDQQAAYMLATAWWETGRTWKPITEFGDATYFERYDAGTNLGATLGNIQAGDGFKFRGRGYVQITGRANYERFGAILGLDLIGSPALALDPATAYSIMSIGFERGVFTGLRLDAYVNAFSADYLGARRCINGADHALDIAAQASVIERCIGEARA